MRPMHSVLRQVGLGVSLIAASCAAPPAADSVAEPFPDSQKEVEAALADVLHAAESKDFVRLESFHLYGPKFTKWDGKGGARLDAEGTRRGERSGLEALDALHTSVEGLKVDVLGPTAISTFVLSAEISAKGQTAKTRSQATMVWLKTSSGWRIVHEHFSPIALKE